MELVGEKLRTIPVEEGMQCCEEAAQMKAEGWTFVPHHAHHKPPPTPAPTAVQKKPNGTKGTFTFKDDLFHVCVSISYTYPTGTSTLWPPLSFIGSPVQFACRLLYGNTLWYKIHVTHRAEEICEDKSKGCTFKMRDTFHLNGELTEKGGKVTATLLNGTGGKEYILDFGVLKQMNPEQVSQSASNPRPTCMQTYMLCFVVEVSQWR